MASFTNPRSQKWTQCKQLVRKIAQNCLSITFAISYDYDYILTSFHRSSSFFVNMLCVFPKNSNIATKYLVEAACKLRCMVGSFTLCYNKALESYFLVFFLETSTHQCKTLLSLRYREGKFLDSLRFIRVVAREDMLTPLRFSSLVSKENHLNFVAGTATKFSRFKLEPESSENEWS